MEPPPHLIKFNLTTHLVKKQGFRPKVDDSQTLYFLD